MVTRAYLAQVYLRSVSGAEILASGQPRLQPHQSLTESVVLTDDSIA